MKAEAPEIFQEFVSADMDLVHSKEQMDEAILAQVNGTCMHDEQDEEEGIVVRKCQRPRLISTCWHFANVLSNRRAGKRR